MTRYFALRDRKTKRLYSVHPDKDAAEGALEELMEFLAPKGAHSFPPGSYGAQFGAQSPQTETPAIEIRTVDAFDLWNYLLAQSSLDLQTDSWVNHLFPKR